MKENHCSEPEKECSPGLRLWQARTLARSALKCTRTAMQLHRLRPLLPAPRFPPFHAQRLSLSALAPPSSTPSPPAPLLLVCPHSPFLCSDPTLLWSASLPVADTSAHDYRRVVHAALVAISTTARFKGLLVSPVSFLAFERARFRLKLALFVSSFMWVHCCVRCLERQAKLMMYW